MLSHIVVSCPLTKLDGALSRFHYAAEDAAIVAAKQTFAYERRSSYSHAFDIHNAGVVSKYNVGQFEIKFDLTVLFFLCYM